MQIEYEIDEDSFLSDQLYVVSKSPRVRKRRRRGKIVVPLIYAACGFVALTLDRPTISVVCFVIASLWSIIYPMWEKRHYVKHYKGFIRENFNGRFGQTSILKINQDYIFIKQGDNESKLRTTEVQEINELSTALFIRAKSGLAIIIPKKEIADLTALTSYLQELAQTLHIPYITDTTWAWK